MGRTWFSSMARGVCCSGLWWVAASLVVFRAEAATPVHSWADLAGQPGVAGSADGAGSSAGFNYPPGVAVDSTGHVFVADASNQTIRKVTPGGVVTTLAGSTGVAGSADGTGSAAGFRLPFGVAVDSAGNVLVADTSNHTIRRITPAGVVTTLAGGARAPGSADGTGGAARFSSPYGVAVDAAGNAFVADSANHTIRKVTPAGVVTTLAGSPGTSGSADGTGSAARFNLPYGVAVDAAGNVYVADRSNHTIRKVTPAGVVTTLAGSAGVSGSADGTGSAARFKTPCGVAVDGSGTVFVADYGNHTIRKVTSAGVVTTVGGSAGAPGTAPGTGSTARFNNPFGVAVDGAGYLFVADYRNHRISKGTPPSPPAITSTSPLQSGTVGVAYSHPLTASGGTTPYAWGLASGSLPAGLSLSSSGVISGTPSAATTASFTVQVAGADGLASTKALSLTVKPPNHAPVLSPAAPAMTTIAMGAPANPGDLLSALLGSSVTDVDSDAVEGLAIYQADSGYGTWEFSLNGGTTWQGLGTVSETVARLLRPADRIRLVPAVRNYTVAGFSYCAWDQTSGTAGATADVRVRGGTKAFSTATDRATIAVTALPYPFGVEVQHPASPMRILGQVYATAGDRVAAFVGNELRGIATVVVEPRAGLGYVNLTVSVKENGETVSFRLWDVAADRVHDGVTTVSAASGGMVGQWPDALLELRFGREQTLALNPGWNHVSLWVRTSGIPVATVLAPILDELALVMGAGQNYDPDLPEFLNTLSQFEDGRGYWLKMAAAAQLGVVGPAMVPAETPIPLVKGWNNVGYVLSGSMAVDTALASIATALVRVTGQGQSYDPTFPPELNTLTTLTPGCGYWVEVSADATLLYPDSAGRGAAAVDDADGAAGSDAPEWQPVLYPTPPLSLLGRVTVDGAEAQPGDVVGAFVGEECRGVGQVVLYDGRAYCNLSIAVAESGETATLVCWQAASGRRLVTDARLDLVSGGSRGVPALPVELPFVTPPDADGSAAVVRIVSAANPTETLASVTLALGWNLISLPADGRTVQDLAPAGGIAAGFIWAGGAYAAVAPDQPLAAGTAVWLFLTVAPRDVTVAGTQPAAVALPVLSPGWNLVGTVTERTVESLAAGAGTGAVSPVWVWDNVAKVYRPETERLCPGRGYWIWWAER